MSFDTDIKQIETLLVLIEGCTQQYCSSIRASLARLKMQYDQKSNWQVHDDPDDKDHTFQGRR